MNAGRVYSTFPAEIRLEKGIDDNSGNDIREGISH